MIEIEFTNRVPVGQCVWATSQTVGFEAQASLKPLEDVLEAVIDGTRRLLVKSEKAGALLYKRVSSGIEKVLVLQELESLELLTDLLLASFRFDKYRTFQTPEEVRYLEKIVVLTDDPQRSEANFARTKAVIEGIYLARTLTSEPANCLYPMAYAERLLELQKYGLVVEILDEAALQKIGMTALLAVGQGSGHPSCVACITWKGSAEPPIALVGKGVCFDSGGLCIKPPTHQRVMKWDKAAAGVVAGTMLALALSNSPSHVVGIVGLVENMPDGKAVKPGDVIKTMSGQTIEIVDTDAEGRLVLADCLWYAEARYQPKALIDLGTLTVETFASLGAAYAGLYSDNEELTMRLLEAGSRTGDALWRLPMGNYFAKQIESSVADMQNLGTEGWGENGAAAEFLKRFVKSPSWAHIDIAGVSWTKEEPKAVTGFGVKLLEEWIHNEARAT